MLIRTVRSGLTESVSTASVCAIDSAGRQLHSSGDPDRPLFYRSAIKPIQATASLEAGARLPPEWLAVACASHGGLPVHLAIVKAILDSAGLAASHLRCPSEQPMAPSARWLLARRGAPPRRPIHHNCSGKHAAMLAASATAEWRLDTYLETAHPLQQRIADLVADTTGIGTEGIGVDGCGVPTFRGNVRGLARSFAKLSNDSRFRAACVAMSRYPALVADNARGDGRLGAWWGGPVKIGAQGLITVGRHGVGIAAKSHDGSADAALVAVIHTARMLGMLPDAAWEALHDVAHPPVRGGGAKVGNITPTPDEE